MDPDRQPDNLPLATHRVLDTHDADHAHDDLAALLAPHRLTPLAPDRPLHVRMHYAPLGPIGIGALTFGPPVEIGVPELDFYLAEIPLRGRLWLRTGDQEMIATPRLGAIINPTDPGLWKRWHENTDVLVVRLERAALLARAETWTDRSLRIALRFDTTLDATAGADGSWLALVWALIRDLEAGHGSITSEPTQRWNDLITDWLLFGHPSTHRHVLLREDEPPAGLRALRHLLEQLHAHPERSWTDPEIARAMGVGVRATQKMFDRHLDMTPQGYLHRIRLARTHADLLAADPSTTSVRDRAALAAQPCGSVRRGPPPLVRRATLQHPPPRVSPQIAEAAPRWTSTRQPEAGSDRRRPWRRPVRILDIGVRFSDPESLFGYPISQIG